MNQFDILKANNNNNNNNRFVASLQVVSSVLVFDELPHIVGQA